MNIFKNLLYAGLILSFLASCRKEDKLDPNSVFIDSKLTQNDLDKYIYENITKPYNIDVLYKYVDKESDMNYNLVPATYDASIRMTRLIQYLGLEPYDDLTGSKQFIRSYFPKLLNYIGSVSVMNNGTVVLGTAENGTKMSLYNLLNLDEESGSDVDYLNYYYFKTIHHEFQHILNQTKPFPSDFNSITGTSYVGDDWSQTYSESRVGLAVADGFISPYASKEAVEDYAELYSYYVTRSQDELNAILTAPGSTAAGRALVQKKLNIVKTYMKDKWGIDMDLLRKNILNRTAKLGDFDQTKIK
ncbi:MULTISPECIES: putative zinc-binding metallopeptidase [unclassified Sphingobacterium]|uniref:zinc-binding metallopeptidase n=1 Tax=unclassified Sphingobacterium TaxID=2609468 RepID=UPI001359B0CB|nr:MULTISPECIES: putative zinc-binding metallopeptidase [unclassified Sphingobacterium]WET71455.1 MAG: putative zinc-binding metallopeptidase [Sphingobacterium sp.]